MNSNNRNIMIIDNKVTNDKYEIGKILKEQYDKEVAEYKTLNKEESIQEIFANLLLLDQSTKRKRKLSRTISKELNHNSRTRKDVDSLFLSVSTQEARTIKPALDYSYFEGMEVFLINDWGEEVKFLKTDKDLEEVISIDFPFMLPTPLPGRRSMASRFRCSPLWHSGMHLAQNPALRRLGPAQRGLVHI